MVEILHHGEGGDVEQVVRTSKQFSCVYNCSYFSLALSFSLLFISCMFLLAYHCMFDIVLYACIRLN